MQKLAYNRIFPHMRSHFSAFLRILSNVNTLARVIYAAYFRNAAYMQHIFGAYFAKFRIFFPHILHQNGPHILRKISAINRYPYSMSVFRPVVRVTAKLRFSLLMLPSSFAGIHLQDITVIITSQWWHRNRSFQTYRVLALNCMLA